MGFPFKKLWSAVKTGLSLAGNFDPRIKMVSEAVGAVEAAMPDQPGADKHATVVALSDAVLASELNQMSPEHSQQVKDARDQAIKADVAARNAVAEAEQAYEKFNALFQAFKTPKAD